MFSSITKPDIAANPWGKLKVACTRCLLPASLATLTSISAAATEITFAIDVYCNDIVDGPRLVIPSWYIIGSGNYDETAAGNNYNVRWALEDKSTGKIWGGSFGGQETAVIDGLKTVLSDPLPIRLAVGSYRIRVWFQGDLTGDSLPVSLIRYSRTTTGQFAVETTDGFLAGSDGRFTAIASFSTGNGTYTLPGGYGLVGTLINQTKPTIVVVGDSISIAGGTNGQIAVNSGAWTMFQESWIAQGLRRSGFYGLKNTAWNCWWLSRGGGWAQHIASLQGAEFRRQFIGLGDVAVLAVGLNDANNGRTSSQIIADLTTIITRCAEYGVAVIGCPLTPATTTTDGHTTASNQTASAASPVIQAVNLWWRDGTAAAVARSVGANFLGLWDGASKVTVNSSNELTATGDRWYAPSGNCIVYTSESPAVHPLGGTDTNSYATSGHTYMAAGVDTSLLTASAIRRV